jgi:hypothetical protein
VNLKSQNTIIHEECSLTPKTTLHIYIPRKVNLKFFSVQAYYKPESLIPRRWFIKTSLEIPELEFLNNIWGLGTE